MDLYDAGPYPPLWGYFNKNLGQSVEVFSYVHMRLHKQPKHPKYNEGRMAQEHTAQAEPSPTNNRLHDSQQASPDQRAGRRLAAFKAAFPLTVPICLGFLFLGASYGILMGTKGFSFVWPMCMSAFIFAGSMEFVTVNLLLSAFNPFAGFLLALMVNARHLFYGLSMLGRFKGLGWKRPYLIFGMCDETYAINSTARIPDTVDRGWFYFWVTVLNQCYWVVGATAGGIIGSHLPFDTTGLDFVLTALFLVIFLDQWLGGKHRERLSAIIGVLAALVCLVIFGAENFMIPALIAMLVLFTILRPHLDTLNIESENASANNAGENADASQEVR
ncbi:putative branched-chain amino acid permease (azaleucine resistance) [Bifidobacterium saguini DSM 23967]|nr:putative branched-chain amino acid permease (azaleucine resistance) [Bifidobacterium saguini DSM 23967]